MNVLNQSLFRRLGASFGHVKVSNQGEAMISRAVQDLDDQPMLAIQHTGEYYQVCCPYCRDTRYRLYVNHRFGKRDALGRPILFVATCFNQNCLAIRENFRDFLNQLDGNVLADSTVKKGKVVPEELREILPPGVTIPLAKLRKTHEARVYLQGRGFDPDVLSEKFGVTYCRDSKYIFARNRIIISIYDNGKLKGWQARHIGDLDWKGPRKKELPPKYFNAPGAHFKSRVIFNWDQMKQWATGIIVEGPTDVFRMGSMSGCIFGNSLSDIQRRMFAAAFRNRTGVLLLDPEEYDSKSTRATLDYFRMKMPKRFCAVKLPDGTDPGSLGREFLRAYVKEQAELQGVKVTYKRCSDEKADDSKSRRRRTEES